MKNAGGLHAGNRLGGNSLADIFTFGRFEHAQHLYLYRRKHLLQRIHP
ncbi:Putative fumarate reductase [Lactobacillus delbrueckii subsp. bulgaricus]